MFDQKKKKRYLHDDDEDSCRCKRRHVLSLLLLLLLLMSGVLIGLVATLVSWNRTENSQITELVAQNAELISQLTNISSLVTNLSGILPVANVNCPTPNDCQVGMSVTFDDVTVCHLYDALIGAACDSLCYIEDANTTCNGLHQCSGDAADCIGTCTITDPTGPIYEQGSPECDDKLTFNTFFLPPFPDPDASANATQWLFLADHAGDCQAIGGCTWYALMMDLIYYYFPADPSPTSINQPGSLFDCVDFLNMSNAACIKTVRIPLDSTQSYELLTSYLRSWLGTSETNWTAFKYVGHICIYQYECGYVNTSAYSDPQYLYGTKRGLASAHSSLASNLVENDGEGVGGGGGDTLNGMSLLFQRHWEGVKRFFEHRQERFKQKIVPYIMQRLDELGLLAPIG